MSAVLNYAPEVSSRNAILLGPFADMSSEALLKYFRERNNVAFFAVPDVEETRRSKIDAMLNNRFEFNGETFQLSDAIDWLTNPSADVEWHILMHKMYYAVGLGLAFSETLNPFIWRNGRR